MLYTYTKANITLAAVRAIESTLTLTGSNCRTTASARAVIQAGDLNCGDVYLQNIIHGTFQRLHVANVVHSCCNHVILEALWERKDGRLLCYPLKQRPHLTICKQTKYVDQILK